MNYTGKRSLSTFIYVVIRIAFTLTLIGLCAGTLVFFFPSIYDQIPFKSSFDYPGLSLTFEDGTGLFNYNVFISIWMSGAALLGILYQLRKLFKNFKTGEIFTLQNVKHMSASGFGVLILAVVNSVTDLLRGTLVVERIEPLLEGATLNPAFRIDPATVFTGLLILIFAQIFKMAKEYKDENDMTV